MFRDRTQRRGVTEYLLRAYRPGHAGDLESAAAVHRALRQGESRLISTCWWSILDWPKIG